MAAKKTTGAYTARDLAVLEGLDGIVTQDDFGSGTGGRSGGAVDLGHQGRGNQDRQGQKEGGNAVHCAFSFMKYRTTRRSWL